MSCSCNGYCNNAECSNHIATCSNSYSFTAISVGLTIDNDHINQIRTAVDGAYTRRGLSLPSWPNYPAAGGFVDTITAARYNTAKTNINALHADLVTSVFSGNILAAHTQELQTDANTVRNECICNYNCTCNINCTCNVNCVCNYHPNILREERVNG